MSVRLIQYIRNARQFVAGPRVRKMLLLAAGRPVVEMPSWREICTATRASAMRARSTIDSLGLSEPERTEISRVVRMAVFKSTRTDLVYDQTVKRVQDSALPVGAAIILAPVIALIVIALPLGPRQSFLFTVTFIAIAFIFPLVLALYQLPSVLGWTRFERAAWRFGYWAAILCAYVVGAAVYSTEKPNAIVETLLIFASLILITRIALSLFTPFEELLFGREVRRIFPRSADLLIVASIVDALTKLRGMANPVRDQQLRLDLMRDLDHIVWLMNRQLRKQLRTHDLAADLGIDRMINRMIATIRLLKSRMAMPTQHYIENYVPQLTDMLRHACRGEWAEIQTTERSTYSTLDVLQWLRNAGKRMAPSVILLLALYVLGQVRGIDQVPLLRQAILFAGLYAIVSLYRIFDPDFLSTASSIVDIMGKFVPSGGNKSERTED
jgi:hypothetical protein